MISIITPTYNRKNMLREVIECIRRQTVKDVELIIIDDCSTDGTDEMMREYADLKWIHYVKNEQNMKDPGYSRHKGFLLSKGEFIVFMDDDDFYIDDRFFEKALTVHSQYGGRLAMVSGNGYNQLEYRNKLRIPTKVGAEGYVDGREFLLNIGIKYKKPLSTFSTVFRRDVLLRADFEHMDMMNDYAIYLRALVYGDAYILPSYIGVYRLHSTNISRSIPVDFLLRNMEERVWTRNHLKEMTDERKISRWWNRQVRIMLKYYLGGSAPSGEDAKKVVDWFDEHSNHDPGYAWAVAFAKVAGKLSKMKNIFKKRLGMG